MCCFEFDVQWQIIIKLFQIHNSNYTVEFEWVDQNGALMVSISTWISMCYEWMNEWMDNDQKNYNNLIKSWHANNLNLNDNQKQTMHANECSNGAATWLQNLSTITFRLINFWTSPKLSTQTGEQWIISKKYWWWHDFKNKI